MCKACSQDYARAYYQDRLDKERERQRNWRASHREYERERTRAYYADHRDERIAKDRMRRSTDRAKATWRKYRLAHHEEIKERARQWSRSNPVKRTLALIRRRARKLDLPDTMTEHDWQVALTYFDNSCAVCGRSFKTNSGTYKPAADHWIPLSDPRPDNPGTVPTNIVPLCHGTGGCNNSKHDRDAKEWLVSRYGKVSAEEIFERIEQFFRIVRSS